MPTTNPAHQSRDLSDDRPAWHRPQIQLLVISLDTKLDTLSGADFNAQEQGLE